MTDPDRPDGSTRSASRRQVLRALSAVAIAGAPLVTRAANGTRPNCVLSPAMTEGPFFIDERLNRSDLVGPNAGPGLRDGFPLALTILVASVHNACAPLAGVHVDVWHTDALGNYSDVQETRGQKFCRGYQVTDAAGRVSFETIYPGWYPGRTIHIHVKARRFDATGNRSSEFTTQLFFDEATNDTVMAMPPYNKRGARRTTNARDGIYGNASSLILATHRRLDRTAGLTGSITLGLDIA